MQKRTAHNNPAQEPETVLCAELAKKPSRKGVERAAVGQARVQKLITQFISSVEQIEILCILMQDVGRRWSAPEILRIVQSSEQSVTSCLHNLKEKGFLESEGPVFFYAPKRPELAQAAQAMCSSYRERRVTITEMIYRGADPR